MAAPTVRWPAGAAAVRVPGAAWGRVPTVPVPDVPAPVAVVLIAGVRSPEAAARTPTGPGIPAGVGPVRTGTVRPLTAPPPWDGTTGAPDRRCSACSRRSRRAAQASSWARVLEIQASSGRRDSDHSGASRGWKVCRVPLMRRAERRSALAASREPPGPAAPAPVSRCRRSARRNSVARARR
ncbi:hypothetical protein GCM10009601_17370 [Streptomyces thermospinosisporus]|uniref:Uncharacterized protein n=1 Tax=Streptomyces thermospinosisporus TaxID=161482 RepID=A0ABN1YQI9_9ACTN